MKRLIGGLLRLIVRAAVLAAVAAIARAVIERLGGERAGETRSGSFDTWPAVPPAPNGRTTTG